MVLLLFEFDFVKIMYVCVGFIFYFEDVFVKVFNKFFIIVVVVVFGYFELYFKNIFM